MYVCVCVYAYPAGSANVYNILTLIHAYIQSYVYTHIQLSCGDINGDGFKDVVISAVWADGETNSANGAGMLFVHVYVCMYACMCIIVNSAVWADGETNAANGAGMVFVYVYACEHESCVYVYDFHQC